MKKVLRWVLFFLLGLVLLFGGLLWFFNTGTGQNYLSYKVFSFLGKKLNTRIEGKISYSVPDWIGLTDFFVQDLQGDTLLYARQLKVDLDMLALLDGRVKINNADLKGTYANIYRKSDQQDFNYQFILNAFASGPAAAEDTSGQSLTFDLKNIDLRDIRIRFKDEPSAMDAALSLKSGKTGFDKLDPEKGMYHLKALTLEGLVARGDIGAQQADTTDSGETVDFRLGDVRLRDVAWQIQYGAPGIATNGKAEELSWETKEFNLRDNRYILEDLILKADRVAYRDKATFKPSQGMNFADLDFAHLDFSIPSLQYLEDRAEVEVKQIGFNEKSGFEIKTFRGNLFFSPKEAGIRDLYLQSGNSVIAKEALLSYESLDRVSDKPGQTGIKLALENSRIGMADILYFLPDLGKNEYFSRLQKESFSVHGQAEGKVDDLNIKDLTVKGLGDTHLELHGQLKNATDPGNMFFDLKLTRLSGNTGAITNVLPAETIPETIRLPEKYAFTGWAKGRLEAFETDMEMTSDVGRAHITAFLKNIAAESGQSYDGVLILDKMNIGHVLKNDSLGYISLNVNAEGTGFDPKTARAVLKGTITEADILGYSYRNLTVDGQLENQKFDSRMQLMDPNADFSWNGLVDFSKEAVTLQGKTDIRNINFNALKLLEEDIQLRGALLLDLRDLNVKKPVATIKGQDIVITKDNVRYPVSQLEIQAVNEDSVQKASIVTGFLDAQVAGQFDFDEVYDLILNEIHKYFELPDYKPAGNYEDKTFRLEAKVKYDPVLTVFVPGLQGFSDISLRASFSGRRQRPLLARMEVPSMLYDSIKITNARIRIAGDGEKLTYNSTIDELMNPSFRIRKAQLDGEVEDNVANFRFVVKDSLGKDIHGLAGNLRSENRKVRIGFARTGAILNYVAWEVDNDGFLEYSPQGIYAESVDFKSSGQHLSINSISREPDAPLKVLAENIDLKMIGTAVFQDSLYMGGLLDADVVLSDYMKGVPAFTGKFKIDGAEFTGIKLGILEASAGKKNSDEIQISAELSGEGNDLRVNGIYTLNNTRPLDIVLDIRKLSTRTIEAFTFGNITKAEGQMTGLLGLRGSAEHPEVIGNLSFEKVKFRVSTIGARLGVDRQTLKIENKALNLSNFTVTDSLGQKMTVDGVVRLNNLPDFSYDLRVRANKFLIVDAVRADNDYFYGMGYVNADIKIKGVNDNFFVDGNVKVDERSRLTMLLPDDTGVGSEMENVITFVNMKDKSGEAKKEEEKPKKKPVKFSSPVSLNVEVDEKSELNIIIDELNGDYIRVKGKGVLTTGINEQGDMYMSGRYDIVEGVYELTYIVIKKSLSILKGSSITWNGKPTEAILDITAAMSFNKQLSEYPSDAYPELKNVRQNVPLFMYLVIKGELTNMATPEFEIAIEKNVVNNIGLNAQNLKDNVGFTLIGEGGEKEKSELGYERYKEDIKKQAIFLLLTGNFSNQLTTANIGESSFNSEDMVRKKLSSVISDQLDQLASSIIKGVDLDLGLASDYNAVNNQRSTNLNLGLSKNFANDRLSVSVGKNFELENSTRRSDEIFDNILVSYNITKDGRYRFKVFRKNLNQMVIEGSVVETGLGFIIAIDYETWKELMKRNKESR